MRSALIAHLAAPADSGGNLLFNFAAIKDNLLQFFVIGAIAAGCTMLYQRQNQQKGRLVSVVIGVAVAALVAFAPWTNIGPWLATHFLNSSI